MADQAPFFFFTLKAENLIVTVHRPVLKNLIPRAHPSPPALTELNDIMNQLTTDMIAPSKTLVDDRNNNRIDNQPAIACYQIIQAKMGDNTYASVIVDKGAELCYVAGYEGKLLKFIKQG